MGFNVGARTKKGTAENGTDVMRFIHHHIIHTVYRGMGVNKYNPVDTSTYILTFGRHYDDINNTRRTVSICSACATRGREEHVDVDIQERQ